MANLDSENKRRSATGIFHLYTIPKYDGGTDAVDREHTTYIYAGIAPGSAAPVTAVPPRNLLLLRVGR